MRDFEQLAALKDTVVQPSFEKATAYAKEVYDVAAGTQADVSKLVEEQVTEFNKQVISALDQIVKTAPAGSEVGIAAMKSTLAAVNSGFDNLTKVAKQFGEATQNNIEVVANQTIEAAKKAKKSSLTLRHCHVKTPACRRGFLCPVGDRHRSSGSRARSRRPGGTGSRRARALASPRTPSSTWRSGCMRGRLNTLSCG